jgi:gas vesicle protein
MRFLVGFLIGMAIGAAVVLLTTPQSGSDLQQGARSRMNKILAEGRRAREMRRAELEARIAELRAS